MCGIVGYAGIEPAVPIILDSLERLQYRGYDSAGFAVLGPDGELKFNRSVGPVANLRTAVHDATSFSFGIGHTRWATHGRPSLENTHPLVSCDGSIAVVHNGVIENYLELRSALEASGHHFVSETDSEVIPHLLEEAVRQGQRFSKAFQSLPSQIHGSFAIVAMVKGESKLYLTRRATPLVVGVSDKGYHPASDIPSFLPYTSRVVYVKEDDCLEVSREGIRRLSDPLGTGGKITPTEILPSESDLEELTKGNFDHFMIKEISEQGAVLQRIAESSPPELEKLVLSIRAAKRVYLVGIGTSYNSALFLDRLAHLSGVDVFRAVVSSEIEQYESHLGPGTVVLALSQSGETADTLSAAKLALKHGAELWGLLNAPRSSIGRICQGVIPISCGPEQAVAATKSYTAQLSRLVQILEKYLYRDSEAERVLKDVAGMVFELTAESTRKSLQNVAVELVDTQDVFMLGRGLQNVTAREAALKLKEVAGVRAEAFYMGEMKHGPLALIHEGAVVVIFHGGKDKANAEVAASELHSRGARVLSVGPTPVRAAKWHIRTADAGVGLPLTQIVPIQVLSYELASLRRMNPDFPKNLAKSVTVS